METTVFGLFRPSCPVDASAKHWIEERLAWLRSQFGNEIFVNSPVILPTDEFFPDPYDGSEASIRRMLDRVCGYMRVDPGSVWLQLIRNRHELELVNAAGKPIPTSAAGTYEKAITGCCISIDTSEIDNPMNLVGTMAHELAHSRLLGERRIHGSEFDNELLTDLTGVFFGLGIFLANSPRDWQGQYSQWPYSSLKRPEYMSLPMYGYALAHRAWHRGERNPVWARHLRWDARMVFKQGLRYLLDGGDSIFRPE
jgi:hypothetical protein